MPPVIILTKFNHLSKSTTKSDVSFLTLTSLKKYNISTPCLISGNFYKITIKVTAYIRQYIDQNIRVINMQKPHSTQSSGQHDPGIFLFI